MNEGLTILFISILSTFVFFSLSYILMLKLRINHPKDKFRIYAVVMTSVLLIFIISISVIGTPSQHQIKIDDSSIKYNEENCSLLVLFDETQLETDDYVPSTNSINHDCEHDLCYNEEGEHSNSCPHKVISFFIHSSNKLNSISSKLVKTNVNSSFSGLDFETPVNENTIFSGLSSEIVNENSNREESNLASLILIFHLILLFLCLSYLIFSLIFSKKTILKNVNARKCHDPNVLQIVKKLCDEIKIKTPKLYIFYGDPNAFIFGYPVSLVISTKLINCLSEEELKIAICHELAHISNKDYLLKPLLQTMRILFFYNPIVHILYYKMMKEREILADSKFINSKVEKIRFMEILLKISDLSKNQNIFSKNIFGSNSPSLVSHKMKKLDITDRYNQLFSNRRKKSFITTLICLFVLFSNISIIAIAQNNFLNDPIEINEELETELYKTDLEDCCNTQSIDSVYIFRLINQKPHLLDIIILEDTC